LCNPRDDSHNRRILPSGSVPGEYFIIHSHDGTSVDGLGEFTIFDWGCGAAASSLAEFKMKVGAVKIGIYIGI
jgi:hypothetical protein